MCCQQFLKVLFYTPSISDNFILTSVFLFLSPPVCLQESYQITACKLRGNSLQKIGSKKRRRKLINGDVTRGIDKLCVSCNGDILEIQICRTYTSCERKAAAGCLLSLFLFIDILCISFGIMMMMIMTCHGEERRVINTGSWMEI